MATFQQLAQKTQKFYGRILLKRKDFNKHEEQVAAHRDADNRMRGLKPSMRIAYGLRIENALKAQGTTYFFSLKSVEREIEGLSPKFNLCKKCLVEMTRLKTAEGDPEGVRSDSKCPKCGDIYGCSKSHQFFLRNKYGSSDPKWKPLVAGDPPEFSFSSNHIRSTINLLRNSKDAGPGVLNILIGLDNYLDEQAKVWREERKEAIESGEMAG